MASSVLLKRASFQGVASGSIRARPNVSRSQVRVMAVKNKEIDQAPPIKVGDKIPDGSFMVMYEEDKTPREVKTSDLVGPGKGRVVFFGLPGAYTSICSGKHVPQFNAKKQALKELGVSSVNCISVNDAWVMRDWARSMGVSPDSVSMLADGEGEYCGKLGMLQYMPGLGNRSIRFSMLVNEEGVVEVLNVEEPGGGSYVVSGPDHMINDIKNLNNVHAKA